MNSSNSTNYRTDLPNEEEFSLPASTRFDSSSPPGFMLDHMVIPWYSMIDHMVNREEMTAWRHVSHTYPGP
jgi:hypothetical protein